MSETPVAQTHIEVPVDVASTSNPLPAQSVANDAPQAKPEVKTEPAEKPSLRDTIAKAAEKAQAEATEKVKAAEAKAKTPAVEAATKDPKVAEGLAPKVAGVTERPTEGQPERPKYEPPSRFNEAARKEWETAPENVRAEVTRVLKENEDGITKYKASHERYEALKQYDELAKSNGIDLKVSLEKINQMENTFARNPLEGFKAVAAHFGYNANEVAAHILGQDPNQQVAEAHQTIEKLQAEIRQMKAVAEAPNVVSDFAEKVGRDKFEANADKVAQLLESGVVDNLDKAWAMISIFGHSGSDPQHKASDANQSQPLTPAQPASAQTNAAAPVQPNPAGQKSVTGAPGFGTKPPSAKPSARSTVMESILRAAARA